MKFYVVAGEASGDSRGVELMRALRELRPDIEFIGAGGREMKAFAGDAIFDWADEAVVGLWDVLKKYGYFRGQFNRMLAEIEAAKPDALITIDYPGFNMRLAKEAKLRMPKLRTIHYISPQVWAWHRGRIPKMAKFLDLMLCLFPFELPLYADAGLRAVCVGHPLLDSLEAEKKEQVRDASLVALLPGSRSKEVRKIFPVMLAAAAKLKASSLSLRFEASAASESLAEVMNCIITERDLGGFPDPGCTVTLRTAHDLMQRAGAGMVCSGTATLESTFFGLPMIILYKVAWLTWFVGKRLVKIPWLGLPNVLAGREIIREFLQYAAKPEPIIAELSRLLGDSSVREEQQRTQAAVIASLGERGAARRAAEAILAG
ncbi:MAG: lipid-A-disaccharide synthase [Verrucomicrobiota bacterium]